jgi:hypothetical protein
MAGNKFIAKSDPQAIGANSSKIVLFIKAPTNIHLVLQSAEVLIYGGNATDPMVLVELCRFSSDGTDTSDGQKIKVASTKNALQFVCKDAFSANPNVSEVLEFKLVHPAGGIASFQLASQLDIAGGERIGFRVTTAPSAVDGVNAIAQIKGEE